MKQNKIWTQDVNYGYPPHKLKFGTVWWFPNVIDFKHGKETRPGIVISDHTPTDEYPVQVWFSTTEYNEKGVAIEAHQINQSNISDDTRTSYFIKNNKWFSQFKMAELNTTFARTTVFYFGFLDALPLLKIKMELVQQPYNINYPKLGCLYKNSDTDKTYVVPKDNISYGFFSYCLSLDESLQLFAPSVFVCYGNSQPLGSNRADEIEINSQVIGLKKNQISPVSYFYIGINKYLNRHKHFVDYYDQINNQQTLSQIKNKKKSVFETDTSNK